ncbi:hypothetical protein OG250_22995 [Streptomyces sp. NBC_00487]|uniref:hypothetical protein n=1 Tax=unclassified Streptomyces TaxID=2593676 RepID=UPI002E17A267|nr:MULTISPECIES: hypothetical protein [unclassified Streptomyces]
MAAVQFTAGHLVSRTLGPLGLVLLLMAAVALRVGHVRPACWAALFFVLLMVQA